MSSLCAVCLHSNPPEARFCAHCGRALQPRRPAPAPPSICCGPSAKRGSRACLWVALAALGVMGVLFLGDRASHRSSRYRSGDIERRFRLDGAERRAMIDLLSPRDVDVLVYPEEPGLRIRGTPGETRTVERFIGLMEAAADAGGDGEREIEQTYKLARSKARALTRALSFAGGVRARRSGSHVTVRATPRAHDTIRRMVHILGGERHFRR